MGRRIQGLRALRNAAERYGFWPIPSFPFLGTHAAGVHPCASGEMRVRIAACDEKGRREVSRTFALVRQMGFQVACCLACPVQRRVILTGVELSEVDPLIETGKMVTDSVCHRSRAYPPYLVKSPDPV